MGRVRYSSESRAANGPTVEPVRIKTGPSLPATLTRHPSGHGAPAQRLERFLVRDIPVSAASGLALIPILVWGTHSAYMLVLIIGPVLNACVGVWALRAARRGRLAQAVAAMCASLWALAVVDVVIAPVILPCFVAVVMLGAILAIPYVPQRQLNVLLVISTAVVAVLAVLGRFQDVTHLTGHLPAWLPNVVVVVWLPVVVALAALSLSHYRANLVDASDELRASATQLEASRRRIVVTADVERRRIERDLHDGAQQTLMAIMLRAGSEKYEQEDLITDLQRAVDELRGLAHGIYPPLLAQRGLCEALRVATERSPVPTTVVCRGRARYRQELESAVYFCCLEAMQNISKHAGPAATALITVWDEGSSVCFSVADDGVGFDGPATARGAGLTNMADRVGAAGGNLGVSSAPGSGTVVHGAMPKALAQEPFCPSPHIALSDDTLSSSFGT